jgi:hypothetical protein
MTLQEKTNWTLGTIIALAGVAAVRIIAPEMIGILNKVVLVSGYIVSLTGIIIIARAGKI